MDFRRLPACPAEDGYYIMAAEIHAAGIPPSAGSAWETAMNPFLESTVATPRPVEGRQPRHRSRPLIVAPHAGAARPPATRKPARQARGTDSPPPAAPPQPPGRLRRACLALGAMLLAGSLAMPAVAYAVDVNAATPEQLQEIKGIGPKMARIIIEERERGGRFESLADLSERVKGIGPKKAAAMQASGLSAGAAAPAKAPAQNTAKRRP